MTEPIPLPHDDADMDGVQSELGARLRAARIANNLGLRELSRHIGVSASMVSQLERGTVMPSVATLYKLVTQLGISLDELFTAADQPAGLPGSDAPDGDGGSSGYAAATGEARVPSPVQRRESRPSITLDSGVIWQRLTTTPEAGVEFIAATYPVGAESCPADALLRHHGREYCYVEKGHLGVTIGFDTFELGPGDSVSFDSMLPHRLFTIGDQPAEVLSMVLGRSGDPRSGT
jgi:transcriptional regulator with XRE-family HTH domain